MNYKGETEGAPLFTSPTLNISRIEVDIDGLEHYYKYGHQVRQKSHLMPPKSHPIVLSGATLGAT